MTVKRTNIKKILVIIFIIFYLVIFSNVDTMKIDAILLLLFSIAFTLKNRNSNLLFIMSFFIFYCNYSIALGEYIYKPELGVPMSEVNNTYIYSKSIQILLLFTIVLTLFIEKPDDRFIKMCYEDNSVIFYVLILVILIIGIAGVNRERGHSYSVNITSIYEYSYILFLFGYHSSGNSVLKKYILSLILFSFVIQDFYLGGRITSLQLIIVFLICLFNDIINSKRIFIGSILGILINTLVGAYRVKYTFKGIIINDLIKDLFRNKFVFDTATYSYYASATHIATVDYHLVDNKTRLRSLFEFLKSIFLGGGNSTGNVTRYVSENYFLNIGGGVFPSHFYFWMGWMGVLIGAFILVYLINKMIRKNSEFGILSLVIIVASSPRWYLYNPLLLFRSQFILFILFIAYIYGTKIIYNK